MTPEASRPPLERSGTALPRYRLGPAHSRFTVQGFAGGLLSFVAHSPTFAVRDFEGELCWRHGAPGVARLDIVVRADSLDLVDKVRPADREDIMRRMKEEVLEVAAYPEIRFHEEGIATEPVGTDRFRAGIVGLLSLHGVTNRESIDAELLQYGDGVRLIGTFPLHLSAYRIRPVTALAGAIQLKDQLRVAFDLAAWREGACLADGRKARAS
jgi:polyisoprenoid-binding protein YceI